MELCGKQTKMFLYSTKSVHFALMTALHAHEVVIWNAFPAVEEVTIHAEHF